MGVVAPVAIRACVPRHVQLDILKKGVGDVHSDPLRGGFDARRA